jgi:hypothetical protein
MESSDRTFDVFLAYNHRDLGTAEEIATVLESFSLSVFLIDRRNVPGDQLEDVLWEAMAESHAFLIVVPDGPPSSGMIFELGAAKAWNKQIFAIAKNPNTSNSALPLHDVEIVPMSRVEEIAQIIAQSRLPVGDDERDLLVDAYIDSGVPVDQLTRHPQKLAKLANTFNKRSARKLSGEQLVSWLLRLRKRGDLNNQVRNGSRN